MIGMDATTGKAIDDLPHLKQCIADILNTRKNTRVKLRDYGSDLPSLIDAPMNRETLMKVYSATVEALQKWETRISISKVSSSNSGPGTIVLDLTGIYLSTGEAVNISGVTVTS